LLVVVVVGQLVQVQPLLVWVAVVAVVIVPP
jgi:hypothetical protein